MPTEGRIEISIFLPLNETMALISLPKCLHVAYKLKLAFMVCEKYCFRIEWIIVPFFW